MGPANEQRSYVITNATGTLGYCDPMYLQTYTLTKESDVYSFGVVLFEVLCGKLCYKHSNGQLEVFVSMWKERCKENKLAEIIFQDLKQQMDATSLEIFADIAYQCLRESRKQRPTMSQVVENLKLHSKFRCFLILNYILSKIIYGIEFSFTPIYPEFFYQEGTPVSSNSREYDYEEKPQKSLNEVQQVNGYHHEEIQELLIKCIKQDLGFSSGKPVAACLIYNSLLHWRSFEDKRTTIFDRITQTIAVAKRLAYEEIGMIRTIYKELSPFLGLCFQAPKTSRAALVKGRSHANAVAQQTLIAHWQSIVKDIDNHLKTMKANFVTPFLVRKCCSFSHGEYVKAGLAELEEWCVNASEEYAGTAWHELKHIRQAVGFLAIHQKPKRSLKELTQELCPEVITRKQVARIVPLYVRREAKYEETEQVVCDRERVRDYDRRSRDRERHQDYGANVTASLIIASLITARRVRKKERKQEASKKQESQQEERESKQEITASGTNDKQDFTATSSKQETVDKQESASKRRQARVVKQESASKSRQAAEGRSKRHASEASLVEQEDIKARRLQHKYGGVESVSVALEVAFNEMEEDRVEIIKIMGVNVG
ncbi:putative myosin ATPase [Tanacetum coccineum]